MLVVQTALEFGGQSTLTGHIRISPVRGRTILSICRIASQLIVSPNEYRNGMQSTLGCILIGHHSSSKVYSVLRASCSFFIFLYLSIGHWLCAFVWWFQTECVSLFPRPIVGHFTVLLTIYRCIQCEYIVRKWANASAHLLPLTIIFCSIHCHHLTAICSLYIDP